MCRGLCHQVKKEIVPVEWLQCAHHDTNLTYELFPAVQVGGSENVVSLQWLQQKVVPDPGDTV